MVKLRPKKIVIVDESSPAVVQAKPREQRVPTELFPRKNAKTKWRPVRQTCKSANFPRRKRAAACFLTAIGPVITKTADPKTIMNYHTRGQTRKNYHRLS